MEKMRDVLHCVDHKKKGQAANAMIVVLSIPYKKKSIIELNELKVCSRNKKNAQKSQKIMIKPQF